MGDKRMLILPAELVKKIDENRGDMIAIRFIILVPGKNQQAVVCGRPFHV